MKDRRKNKRRHVPFGVSIWQMQLQRRSELKTAESRFEASFENGRDKPRSGTEKSRARARHDSRDARVKAPTAGQYCSHCVSSHYAPSDTISVEEEGPVAATKISVRRVSICGCPSERARAPLARKHVLK